MKFGVVYDSTYCHISAQNVRQALPENDTIHFDLSILKPNVDIRRLLGKLRSDANPDLIVHETGAPGLPRGLDMVPVPTACLDIDTFVWTNLRVRWSLLFDYVFTWHPCFLEEFKKAGHPNVFVLPHAVDGRLFGAGPPELDRPYAVGFVGNLGAPQYRKRDGVLANLANLFPTNDFRRKYNAGEMVEVYQRSKVVVNVSRFEFSCEANMRCYEAMAAGALLLTGMPTELTEWGFREGEHFVGWRSDEEIPVLVNKFIHDEEKRRSIAHRGQQRTLRDFTYQRCVEAIMRTVQKGDGELMAPARQWPAEQVHLLYLSYYHRFRQGSAALEEFRRLRRASPRAYWKGLPMMAKALRHSLTSGLS